MNGLKLACVVRLRSRWGRSSGYQGLQLSMPAQQLRQLAHPGIGLAQIQRIPVVALPKVERPRGPHNVVHRVYFELALDPYQLEIDQQSWRSPANMSCRKNTRGGLEGGRGRGMVPRLSIEKMERNF